MRGWSALVILLLSAPASARSGSDADRDRAVHDRAIIIDTHLDTPANLDRPGWSILERHDGAEDFSQVDLPRMLEGGLDGGFFAVYTPQGPRTAGGYAAARDAALGRAVRIREMIAASGGAFELATTSTDAVRIAMAHKRIAFLSIENAYPLGTDITLLRTFDRLGVRMLGIVHLTNNQFGDSSTDPAGPEWHGLSPAGRALVAEGNRRGIILDASHASDAVFDELLDLSAAPIILSHSGCRAIFDHPRNLDDARIRLLAAKGGVIQIDAVPFFKVKAQPSPERDAALAAIDARFGPQEAQTPAQASARLKARREVDRRYPLAKAGIDQFMAHLLHALEIGGVDHVGIGMDWDGGGGGEGLEDVTALPRVTARLLQAGYSETDIDKILGGNVLRLLDDVQRLADPSLNQDLPS